MNVPVTPTYQIPLVVLSYAMAVIGSLVALTAARRLIGRNGKVNRYSAISAGIALGGIGVWSMHFVGMLAVKINMGVSYSMLETIVSLVAAVAATSVALVYVAQAPRQLRRVVGAGSFLGLGVALMHYLGMYGMRFGGFIAWEMPIVALSIFMAMVAASAALWLAFNTPTWTTRILSALIMGVAVCAMHYTGMAAADFICTTATPRAIPDGFGVISSLQMPVWVLVFAVGSAFVIAMDQFIRQSAGIPAAQRA
ncbi:MHYT domain-containing protein [Variovorax sp. J22R133]|uniref:MHYT domain-containing protein n=1 Tax=Variovorax brevis TaxID=3053503 RepID=UPI00257686FE|nr:MHYT domain-containing protein [Variovorax sp. J22R133]MDM0111028.1 MHYT domain-containing protein [Variovorax sp. J22R133]